MFPIAAMHLFGLNWHLQPTQRQMYQLSDDNTSGLPFPTDLSLSPLGNTGLEIPKRKGKDDSKCVFLFNDDLLFVFFAGLFVECNTPLHPHQSNFLKS